MLGGFSHTKSFAFFVLSIVMSKCSVLSAVDGVDVKDLQSGHSSKTFRSIGQMLESCHVFIPDVYPMHTRLLLA
jgi:hypothetical protein